MQFWEHIHIFLAGSSNLEMLIMPFSQEGFVSSKCFNKKSWHRYALKMFTCKNYDPLRHIECLLEIMQKNNDSKENTPVFSIKKFRICWAVNDRENRGRSRVKCNTNWVEIQRELLPGQKWFDRPDLVCRGTFVSHQKNVLSFQAKDGYAAEGFEWKSRKSTLQIKPLL